MNTTFDELTQPFFKPHYEKDTSVLALIMFQERRVKITKNISVC